MCPSGDLARGRHPAAPGCATPPAELLPVVADQARTMAWLTAAIERLRQQLAAAQHHTTQARQEAAQAQQLRAERSILQATIDS